MRRRIYVLLFFIFCITTRYAKAQDIHFSQYNNAPMELNPALTGVNGGDYRLVANYRNQWAGVGNYNTEAVSYDMGILRKTARSNYGGIGISMFTDRAGDLSFSTTQVNINMAYTVILNHQGTQSITGGLVGGMGQRSIDYSKVTTDNMYIPDQGLDVNAASGEHFGKSSKIYADVGAGILWNYTVNRSTNLYLGGAVDHLNQPNLSLLNDPYDKLFIKSTLHGGAYFQITHQIFLMPSFAIFNQGPAWEYNAGALVKFKTSSLPTDRTAFYVGAAYRINQNDAIIFQTRLDIRNFNIGLSYDLNVSKLTPATKLNGGPELSLIYVGLFTNKKTSHAYCPML